jgi:hypothetical protein
VISNVLPLHLVPFVVEHSPACGRTNTGQYDVNLVAGAPATEMDLAAGVPVTETGTHTGDRHRAGAPVMEGRQTERVHRPGTQAGGGTGDDRRRAGVVHRTEGRQTERVHMPRIRRRGCTGREGTRAEHAHGWWRERRLASGGRRGRVFPTGAGGESIGEIWKLLPMSVSAACGHVCAWVSLIRRSLGYLLTSNSPTPADGS